MDQHKQTRGKRKQAPLQHSFPVFVPTGQQLTHFQQQRDVSIHFTLILSLFQCLSLPLYVEFISFKSMLNVLFLLP